MSYKMQILFLTFLSLSIFISGCYSSGEGNRSANVVKGTITVIGNEPFTQLAVRTDNDKVYVLQCSKELKEELLKQQGNYYYIQFGGTLEKSGTTTLIVEKVIPIVKEFK